MLRHYMPIFLIQGGPNGTISFQFYLIPRLTSMGTEIIFEKLFSVYSIESPESKISTYVRLRKIVKKRIKNLKCLKVIVATIILVLFLYYLSSGNEVLCDVWQGLSKVHLHLSFLSSQNHWKWENCVKRLLKYLLQYAILNRYTSLLQRKVCFQNW